MNNDYFSIKDVCNILCLHQSSMSRYINDGVFPFEIEGVRYKIKKIDVLYYITEGEFPKGNRIYSIRLRNLNKTKVLKFFNEKDYKQMYDEYYTSYSDIALKLGIRTLSYEMENLFNLIFELLDMKFHYCHFNGNKYVSNRNFETFLLHYKKVNPF